MSEQQQCKVMWGPDYRDGYTVWCDKVKGHAGVHSNGEGPSAQFWTNDGEHVHSSTATVDDNSTLAVQIGDDEAHGLIFHPGDTLIVTLPDGGAQYSDEALTEIVNTLRQAMGDKIEIVVLGPEMRVHKAVRVPTPWTQR